MDIIIIGTGPAGLMCAVESCKNENNNVILLDGNEKIGKKLFITGKGRCNVCNNTTTDNFLKNVVNNSKFLYSAINKFSPQDTINFFETNGTMLKTERGNRVFPVSDKSSDIIKTFSRVLNKPNVTIKLNSLVKNISKINKKFKVETNTNTYFCDYLVIATGGKSYSSTGSKGDGYLFAKKFGHNVVQLKPALVPINLKDYKRELAGLTLKNISANISLNGKNYFQFGELLFTHTGVSGPIILSLSSYINSLNIKGAKLVIDLKPKLSIEILDTRLLNDFNNFKFKSLKNYLKELLPSSLINIFLQKNDLNENMQLCNINKKDRQKIIFGLKNFSYIIDNLEEIEYGIITSGGVDIKEINPKNMQSKLVENLFFIGEVLDVDALTGGYNIQIALSTGYSAGEYLKDNIKLLQGEKA